MRTSESQYADSNVWCNLLITPLTISVPLQTCHYSIPEPIDYICIIYLVMPGQSDGDPLDRDLHSRPPSPLMPSSHSDWASYAPQTVPSSTENLYICPPIDVSPTGIQYHLQYSIPESFPTPLSDSSACLPR